MGDTHMTTLPESPRRREGSHRPPGGGIELGSMGEREVSIGAPASPTDKKTQSVSKKAIGALIVVLLVSVIISPVLLGIAALSRKRTKARAELKSNYEKLVAEALIKLKQTTREETLPGPVKALWFSLGKESSQEIRSRLVSLAENPEYQRLRAGHPAIEFVEDVAYTLETVNADQAFLAHAKSGYSFPKEGILFSDFGKHVRAVRDGDGIGFSRDGRPATIAWAASHLGRLWHVLSEILGAKYDSYNGQSVFARQGRGNLTVKYGPGITGPRSLMPLLIARAKRKGNEHIIHASNQSPDKKGEMARLVAAEEWARESGGVFTQAVLATDTPNRTNRALIHAYDSGDCGRPSFVKKYIEGLRGEDNSFVRNLSETKGIYIPKNLLDDRELEAALQAAESLSLSLISTLGNTKEANEKAVNIVRMTVLGTLGWAIMKKAELSGRPTVFSQACKENIDRGPTHNLLLFLMDAMVEEGTLSPKEAEIQIAINLGRAHYAMDRPCQKKRVGPLSDVTEFMTSETGVSEVQKALRSLREALSPKGVDRVSEEVSSEADGVQEALSLTGRSELSFSEIDLDDKEIRSGEEKPFPALHIGGPATISPLGA